MGSEIENQIENSLNNKNEYAGNLIEYFNELSKCLLKMSTNFSFLNKDEIENIEKFVESSKNCMLTSEDLEGKKERQKSDMVVGEYFANAAHCFSLMAHDILFRSQWGYETSDWFDHRLETFRFIRFAHFIEYSFMLVYDALKVFPQNGKLLDLCSGDSFYSYHLFRHMAKEIVCVDKRLNHAKRLYKAENIKYIETDVLKYSPEVSYYDVVIIRGAIEHFSYDTQQMIFKKALKALKPGGFFLGDTPACPKNTKMNLKHENEWEDIKEMKIDLSKVFSIVEVYDFTSAGRTTLFWKCTKDHKGNMK